MKPKNGNSSVLMAQMKRVKSKITEKKKCFLSTMSVPPTEEELRQAVTDAEVALGVADENLQDAETEYDTALDAWDDAVQNGNLALIQSATVALIVKVRAVNLADRAFRQAQLDLSAAQAVLLFFLADQ